MIPSPSASLPFHANFAVFYNVIDQVSLVGLPALLVLLQHLEFFSKVRQLITLLYVESVVCPAPCLVHVSTSAARAASSLSQNTTTSTTGMCDVLLL